jgi:NTE family protein
MQNYSAEPACLYQYAGFFVSHNIVDFPLCLNRKLFTIFAMKQMKITSQKIGLALGGGATRGAAHIGVLQALEDNGIQPSCIAGTSMGALVGALYAFDVPLSEIRALAHKMSPLNIVKFGRSKLGLLSNKKLADILIETIGKVNIEDAHIPLAIVATDINTGNEVIIRTGDVGLAVLASTCLPGVFKPIVIDDTLLVDGGLVEDVPISPLRSMGVDVIIAVNLGAERKYKSPQDAIDVLINSYDIVIDQYVAVQIRDADVLIEPKLAAFQRNDIKRIPELISEGYRATSEQIEMRRYRVCGEELVDERARQAWIT